MIIIHHIWQMRDAVAEMESCIWGFRTRTGAFQQVDGSDAKPVLELRERIVKCRDQIIESADVQVVLW